MKFLYFFYLGLSNLFYSLNFINFFYFYFVSIEKFIELQYSYLIKNLLNFLVSILIFITFFEVPNNSYPQPFISLS